MTLSEAKLILETEGTDLDEVKDRYEESVFRQVQIFLKDPVIPSLVDSRLKKMKDASDAFLFFHPENDYLGSDAEEPSSLKSINNWKEFWEVYENNKAMLRKRIAGSYLYSDLEKQLHFLTKNELEYAGILICFSDGIPLMEDAKISEAVQAVEILKECESLRDRGLIDSSLDSLKNISDNFATFNLSKEVNRLRKLLKHG